MPNGVSERIMSCRKAIRTEFLFFKGWKEFTSVWKLNFSMDDNTWEILQVIRIVIFEKFEKNL